MRIAIDYGHNIPGIDVGATGYLNGGKILEDTFTKEIAEELHKRINSKVNSTAYLVTPKTALNHNDSLMQRCINANNLNVDLFLSIHINAGGGTGTEVYGYNNNLKELGFSISYNIAKALNLKNRGFKINDFCVLRNTKMPALLIECFFIDNAQDVMKYDKGKIVNAIMYSLNLTASETKIYRVQTGAFTDLKLAEEHKDKLKSMGIDCFIVL